MRRLAAFPLTMIMTLTALSTPAWAYDGVRGRLKRWGPPPEETTNVLGFQKIFGHDVLNDDVVDTSNRFPLVEFGLGTPIVTIPFGGSSPRLFNSATLGFTLNWWKGFYNDDVQDHRRGNLENREPSKDHRIAALSPSLSYIMIIDKNGNPQHGAALSLNVLRWDSISLGFGLAYHTEAGAFGTGMGNLTWFVPLGFNFGVPGT